MRNGLGALGAVRRGILLALVFATPLFFLWEDAYDPFNRPKFALMTACVAAAGSLRIAEALLGRGWGDLARLTAPATFFATPALVAWSFTDYKAWSLLGEYSRMNGLMTFLLVAAAGILLADAFARDFRRPAWAFASSAALVAAYGVAQSVGIDPYEVPIIEYAPSSVGHSNFVGAFLAIALPVSLALWTSASGLLRLAATATSTAIMLGIVMTFSQGGWLATAGGIVVFAGLRLRGRHRRAPLAGAFAAAAVAAAGVGLVVLSMIQPFHSLVPDTARARGFWWQAALSLGAESPVWGHGPNVHAVEGPHHRVPEDALAHGTLLADAPHSVPLEHFANEGLLGVAGYLALLAWLVSRGRMVRSPLACGCVAGGTAYFVQSLVSIDSPLLLLGLWICLAGSVASEAEAAPEPAGAPGRRVALASLSVLAVSAAAVWWSVSFVAQDARFLRALSPAPGQTGADAFAELHGLVDETGREFYRIAYATALGQEALLEGPGGAEEIELMTQEFSFLEEFPALQGMRIFGETLHEWAVFDSSRQDSALEQLERVLRLDPYSPSARVAATEALIHMGRTDEAVATMEFMRPEIHEELAPYAVRLPELWGALSVAYFHDGRVDDARAALADAVEADAGPPPERDCHVLVAQELLRRMGEEATRAEYVDSSPGLLACRFATLALLPGYDPASPQRGIP